MPGASDITVNWSEDKSESTTANKQEVSRTVNNYYETWQSGSCNPTDNYQKYEETIVVTEEEETVSSFTRKYTITGWMVGDQLYGLGETVNIIGTQTVQAVITFEDSGHKTEEFTLRTTTTSYQRGRDTEGTPPNDGTAISTSKAQELDNYVNNPKVETSRIAKN